MKPYSKKDTVCVKCGCTGATTEYNYGGMGRSSLDGPPEKLPDFLLRTCARCGYSWREAPLDATTPESKAEEKGKPEPRHIESYDSQAICLCEKQVVAYKYGLYACPNAPIMKRQETAS